MLKSCSSVMASRSGVRSSASSGKRAEDGGAEAREPAVVLGDPDQQTDDALAHGAGVVKRVRVEADLTGKRVPESIVLVDRSVGSGPVELGHESAATLDDHGVEVGVAAGDRGELGAERARVEACGFRRCDLPAVARDCRRGAGLGRSARARGRSERAEHETGEQPAPARAVRVQFDSLPRVQKSDARRWGLPGRRLACCAPTSGK